MNNVCEELAPIEVDITNFILSSCRLTHQMLDIDALRHTLQLCDSVSRSSSTAMSYCDDEHDAEESTTRSERSAHNKVLITLMLLFLVFIHFIVYDLFLPD